MTSGFLARDMAISVFTAWFAAQVLLKIITASYKKKKFFWKAAFMGGGMPSGHSALVAALLTAIALSQGFSVILIMAFVFSAIVIYEVLLAKRVVADFLNVIAEKHPKKHLLEELGHSIMEVLVGVLIGVVVVLAFYYR